MRSFSTGVFLAAALAVGTAGAAVGDFVRTVLSTKLNGWDGITFIKWEKTVSSSNCGRGWAVKIDLSKGYRLRTQLGDAAGNKARVGTMAETIFEAEGIAPIVGMNADYFDTGSSYARPTGLVITDDALATAGWPNNAAPEMCYIMQTADGNLVHANLLRTPSLPSGYPTAAWQVTAPNGRKIRQAVRTNYCNYPVKAGVMNPVANPVSSGGATFPTTIGNMQNRTTYPRPLVGIATNGAGRATMLMLFLNDGRQTDWSCNFPDVDAYQIMIDEGCSEVGEFDGGGSAAMWMAFGADSVYNFGTSYQTAHGNYVNKPSDGSPRKDACGLFVLPPETADRPVEVNDGNLYADVDRALAAAAPGDTVRLLRAATLTGSGPFARSCTVTSGDFANAPVTFAGSSALAVTGGVRVLFRDVAFKTASGECSLAVGAGSTAAVAGRVGFAQIVTADAGGFEVADTLQAAVTVACAAAAGAGSAFGRSSLAEAAVAASLPFIRHPSDPALVAAARTGTDGTELYWRVGLTFSGSSETAGFNYTNRTVSVTVGAVDGTFAAGTKIRLVVRDAAGNTVASLERALAGAGTYTFDTAEAAASTMRAGMNYTYAAELVGSDGNAVAGADAATGAFVTATPARWFAARAADDSAEGGAWQVKPEIRDGVYDVASGTTYSFAATESRSGLLRVTMEAFFYGGFSEETLSAQCTNFAANPPQSVLTIKERGDGTLVWAGLAREEGQLAYRELFGQTPAEKHAYTCRQEIDYGTGAPRVSYLVAEAGGSFVRLADGTGTVWFAGPDTGGTRVSSVELEGVAEVSTLVGDYADQSTLRVNGKEIVLLTNVILDTRDVETNVTYDVVRNDHAFRWTDAGRSAVYDAAAGTFRVSAGAAKNGLPSHASYVLNMDPDDPDSKPVAVFVRDETTGQMKIKLQLANGAPFEPRSADETGYDVKVALEAADNVQFSGSETGAKCAADAFAPAIDTTAAPAQFYRCHIYLEP